MAGGKEDCKSETGVDTRRGVKPFAGVSLTGVVSPLGVVPLAILVPKAVVVLPTGFIPVTCPYRLAVVFSTNGC